MNGLQASQRDWSPFLVHFTSYRAMGPIRSALPAGCTPQQVSALLDAADSQSFVVWQAIAASGQLKSAVPQGKEEADACVCLSECTLPGLISLAERYGRFGLGFRKADLFGAGARPCAYLAEEHYAVTKRAAITPGAGQHEKRLHDLSNVYRPAGFGLLQDFTHEREWRIFADVALAAHQPDFLIAPSVFVQQTRALFGQDALLFPLDMLFEWGA